MFHQKIPPSRGKRSGNRELYARSLQEQAFLPKEKHRIAFRILMNPSTHMTLFHEQLLAILTRGASPVQNLIAIPLGSESCKAKPLGQGLIDEQQFRGINIAEVNLLF